MEFGLSRKTRSFAEFTLSRSFDVAQDEILRFAQDDRGAKGSGCLYRLFILSG